MNISDLLIIYLACGAPFGVYYFFEHLKGSFKPGGLIPGFLLAFLFWVPYSLWLLTRGSKSASVDKFAGEADSDSETSSKITSFQKNLEKILVESDLNISIYAFREIFERYTGLTLTVFGQAESVLAEPVIHELFDATKNSDPLLSTICLVRRNRQRLSFHQISARRDFLKVLEDVYYLSGDKKNLANLALQFAKLLNDTEAQAALAELFGDSRQTENDFAVTIPEKELWKTDAHKPLPANPSSVQ